MQFVVRPPGPPAVADNHRHTGVDDYIAGDVQVGDAPRRVHHRQLRPGAVNRLNVGFDGRPLFLRQPLDAGVEFGDAVVGVDPQLPQRRPVLVQRLLVVNRNAVAEDDGVGNAHHRRFQMQRQQHFFGFGLLHFRGVEPAQLPDAHHGAVDDFAGQQRDARFQRRNRPVGPDEFDGRHPRFAHGQRLFRAVEIARRHMGDAGFGNCRPLLHHPVGVALAVFLDGVGRAPVGVALPQYGVDGAAQHSGKARLDLAFRIGGRFVGVVGNGVALFLQLPDGAFQLGNGGADVGQLDDVGARLFAQLGAHIQVVGDLLFVREVIGEIGDDAAGQRNVPGLQLHAGAVGKGPENRQQRMGGQRRRLIDFGVDYLGRFRHFPLLGDFMGRLAPAEAIVPGQAPRPGALYHPSAPGGSPAAGDSLSASVAAGRSAI